MNVDEALRQFAVGEDLPRAAMRWALDHWDEAAPRFIARLRAFAAGGERGDAAMDELFFIVHLCGEKRETRAYEPLCRLIAEGQEAVEFLGDSVTETLTGILVAVCDGDSEPLTRAIEAESGDEFARAAALEALAYLVRAENVLGDDAMRTYLRRLLRKMKPRPPSFVWETWAATAACLGYADMRAEVAGLIDEGLVEARHFDMPDFDEYLGLAREDAAGLAAFAAGGVAPIDDAIATLETWSRGDEFADEDDPDAAGPFEAPYVNPFRDVGRNDACPCGSGKKFKKCCLAG